MRGVSVLCVLAACSGPHPQLGGDGGLEGDAALADGGPSDAAIDAPPDAAPCPSVDDHDGDGICDAVDDCPDIADPGQPDLDGDGIGWMCDPVESVTLDSNEANGLAQHAFHGTTFAARTTTTCAAYNVCDHELLQVSAAGKMIVRSDSTSPVDTWQAAPAVPWMDGPYITTEDRVLWSRGYGSGDTGDFDLATRQFTSRANGVFGDVPGTTANAVLSGGALIAGGLDTASLAQDFDEVHADGALTPIAMAQSFGFDQPTLEVPGPVPRAIVPVRESFTSALRLYTQGVGLTDILVGAAPMTNLDSVQTVDVDGQPAAICAERDNQVIVVDWDRTNAVAAHVLPLPSCLQLQGTQRGDARFYYASNGPGVAYVYAGAVSSITTFDTPAFQGSTLPVLIFDFQDVWLVAADGSNRLLESGGTLPLASIAGDTINVFSHHEYAGHTDGYGTYDLTRFRGAQPPVSVTIYDNVVNGIFPTLVTTAEGAALISSGGMNGYVVPSNTMTPIVSPVGEMHGGLRDGRTIVFGRNFITLAGTVYTYDETTGTPRFTALDTVGGSLDGALIDAAAPTSWFAYSNAAVGYKLARVDAGGTLDSIVYSGLEFPTVVGTRADGAVLISDGTKIYALTSTDATVISARPSSEPILDTTVSPPVLVGWIGSAGLHQRFACLAMHPERCWSYPVTTFFKTTEYASSAGDGQFALILELVDTVDKVTVEVVRSIGPGTFTP